MKRVITAQEKEVYMYVAEDATYATGNQAIFQASEFLGAAVVDSTHTIFRFRPQNATHVLGTGTVDTFTLTHTEDAHIEVMKTVGEAMSNAHGGFVVIQDDLGTTTTADGATAGAAYTDLKYPPILSTGTAVAVTEVVVATI